MGSPYPSASQDSLDKYKLPFIHSYRDDGILDFGREHQITLLCKDKEVETVRVDLVKNLHRINDARWEACEAMMARHQCPATTAKEIEVHPDGIVYLTVEEFDHLQGECDHGICNYARKMQQSMARLAGAR